MQFKLPFQRLSLAFLLGLSLSMSVMAQGETPEIPEPTLTIGDDAPPIDIEHWLTDNNGLFLTVEEFEDGMVYVIDFWAPSQQWAPTVRMLPQLVKLQKKFEVDDVQIISVGMVGLERAEEFLEKRLPRDIREDGVKTYGDLVEPYCFTTDPDESVYTSYLKASGQTQVPTSFVVGKDGKIEWIGHPQDLEKPLQKIVDGKWDRKAFAETYQAELKKQQDFVKAGLEVRKALQGLPRTSPEDAIEFLGKAIDEQEMPMVQYQLAMLRIQLMVRTKSDKTPEALREIADKYTNEDNAIDLNNFIWTLYERQVANGDVPQELMEAGLHAAKVAVKFEPDSGAINDTVAHFVYEVEGDLDEAIKWQKKAVEVSEEERKSELQPFLDELLEEKKTGKKKNEKKSDKKGSKEKEKSDF